MTHKQQHTATPWEVNGLEIQAKNKHETLIAEVYEENEFSKANAEFIVKAVNNHNALVEALKNSDKRIRELHALFNYKIEKSKLTLSDNERAIAKAEGREYET